ncbi:hypothetical protein [Granulicoccus sp. GXG6511]|uniref:hypothetical protein n=1 Tax=Granulicoccus sp. GXG6511 TaxID=3381351 RepID=UPI003D7C97CC
MVVPFLKRDADTGARTVRQVCRVLPETAERPRRESDVGVLRPVYQELIRQP